MGDLATPRTYSVPKAKEATVDIPVDFFLHGWIHVLRPSEIATWLMFRELAWRFPREHHDNGVYVYGHTREDEYGLNRDAYEGHLVLRELGLLRFAPGEEQDAIGMLTVQLTSRYDPHRFQLVDEGLAGFAVPRALEMLDERLAGTR